MVLSLEAPLTGLIMVITLTPRKLSYLAYLLTATTNNLVCLHINGSSYRKMIVAICEKKGLEKCLFRVLREIVSHNS